MGNRTAEMTTDPNNNLTGLLTRVYNSLSQLSQQLASAGTPAVTTTFGYDSNGNVISINAPLARNAGQVFDALNRLIQVTDPNGGITTIAFDANDKLISVSDPMQNVTTYTRDGLGDLLQQVSPDTGATTFAYDSAGNLQTKTDARGAVGTYTYDALNRPTQVQFTGESNGATLQPITKSFTYDTCTNGRGRLCQMEDEVGVTQWTYTIEGRIATRTENDVNSPTSWWSPGGQYSLSYGYNAAGQLTSLQLPSGATIAYSYNGNNQVSGISVTAVGADSATTVLSGATYEPFGPVNGWTWGNGATVLRSRNQDGNLTTISSTGLHASYSYDNAQRVSALNDLDNSTLSWTYAYDLLDRLVSAADGSQSLGWTYDANGNRLTQTGANPQSYVYGPSSNRFQENTSGNPSLFFDAAGNPTNLTGLSDTILAFDAEGNLSSIGPVPAYTNGMQQRLGSQPIWGYEPRNVYDDQGRLVGEYEWDPTDFPSAPLFPLQETIWLGDVPVATLITESTFDGDGNYTGWQQVLYYVHSDHLNTPRRLTQPSDNTLAWRWDSDPFGNGNANGNPSGGSTWLQYDLRFPGQVNDWVSGTYYNMARDYDPLSGRYVESDPIGLAGGSYSTYTYVSDRPTMSVDPRGLYDCTYSISAHSMSCTPSQPGHPNFSSPNYVSGNNNSSSCQNCQNNPDKTNVQDHGPIPVGTYSIGAITRPGGSRRRLTPDPVGRTNLELHGCKNPATCSDGCIGATTNADRDLLNRDLSLEEGQNTLTVVP
jgi:RHS repeat-associated protein